jgi:acylphosphatase
MVTAHVFISGFVQGVGYRQFVKKHAEELGLTGWVKNLPDGRVEAVFQGEKKLIEQLIEFCKKGPFMAEVEDVEVGWKVLGQKLVAFTIEH